MAGTSKSRNTTSKSTSAKGKTGRPRKNTGRKQVEERPEFIRTEVLLIGSFAIAVLLFLSNFHLCGMVGDFLRTAQLGMFGTVGYIFPILLFTGTCFYMSNRGNPVAMVKFTAMIIAIFALSALLQLMFGAKLETGQKLLDLYRTSSLKGTGGGLFGGSIAMLIVSAIGAVGAYLVLVVILVICAVCITEKSLVSVVKKGGDKAYQYAKDDMDRRREQHIERQEERNREREERKVRGVNLDSTKIEDIPDFETESLEALSDSLESAVADAAVTAERTVPLRSNVEAVSSVLTRRSDIFTGSIVLPGSYDDDSVPFDVDVIHESYDTYEAFGTDISRSDIPEEIHLKKLPLTLGETDMAADEPDLGNQADSGVSYNGFFIPDEPKRVVTSNGKIIETDTEALQKKLETRRKEAQESGDVSVVAQIQQQKQVIKKEYKFPPLTLLKKSTRKAGSFSDKEYKETAIKLQQTLQNFGVGVTVTNISCGPSVTRYELHPEQGVKVSKIVGLTDDIKLSLAAADIRIEAPIPGKSAVGIEVPNKENNMVLLRELFESDNFQKHPSKMAFAVGKDIGGQVVVADIGKMPHLLIAGATGSGKSVCINTIIMSIIFKASPDDVKLIMIDPKVVELSVYNGIPHLLIPVVTDPKKASGALNWGVAEMTDRYKKFADYNVRDLKGYNEKIQNIEDIDDSNKPQKLPQIIIIVDELADLMMVAPGEVEDAICRLAQLARAAGIHLVIATQRPSVNVITGLIKANVPSRIAFSVSSGVDSRTIIDMNGAEKLLGKGDMLFYPAGFPKPQRVQGAFVSDSEVQQVVDFLNEQGLTADYNPEVENKIAAPGTQETQEAGGSRDDYFIQAGKFIIEKDKASIGMLQRMFKIGFNRAARIMDQLAEAGVVGEEEGTKPRKVLITMEEFDEMIDNGL